MSRFWKRSMGLMAVLALAGCGGPVEESEEIVMENEQALQRCSVDLPCPPNQFCYHSTPGSYYGVCKYEL